MGGRELRPTLSRLKKPNFASLECVRVFGGGGGYVWCRGYVRMTYQFLNNKNMHL